MNGFKEDVCRMQRLASEAFSATGRLASLANSGPVQPKSLQKALESTADELERTTLQFRRLCEKHSPGVGG